MAKAISFMEFRRRAQAVFDQVPDEYRRGVDELVVERQAVPDPELEDVYTLGECATGEHDPDPESPRTLRSFVVLYYGSFVALSRLDDAWDWDEEIWETITHEIRHHRETAAGEDALEDVDYADDQSFLRREGKPFDPHFYRSGEPAGPAAWEVARELFVERRLTDAEFAALPDVHVAWEGGEVRISRPAELGDVHFVEVDGAEADGVPVTVVLVRKRGAWETLRGLFSPREPRVLESRADALPLPVDG